MFFFFFFFWFSYVLLYNSQLVQSTQTHNSPSLILFFPTM